MFQFLVYVSSVIGLAQNYRPGRTFGNADATGLALVSRYLDGAGAIQIRHVIGTDPEAGKTGGTFVLREDLSTHATPQASSGFTDGSFPVIDQLNWRRSPLPWLREKGSAAQTGRFFLSFLSFRAGIRL